VKHAADNRSFKQLNPDLKLPPPYMLFEAYGMNYRRYFEQGRNTASGVVDLFQPYLPADKAIVLDWGCGPSRLTRHLNDLLPHGSTVRGTDYNPETIAWCKQALPQIEFKQCDLAPPLPYLADETDAIISISIFTHLSAKRHQDWLDELARILKPNGVLMVTTHGDSYKEVLTTTPHLAYTERRGVVQECKKGWRGRFGGGRPAAAFRALIAKE